MTVALNLEEETAIIDFEHVALERWATTLYKFDKNKNKFATY